MNYERHILLRHSMASVVALGLTGLSRFIYSVAVSRRFGVEELGRANSLVSQAFLLAIPLSFFAVALGKYSSEFLGRGRWQSIRAITGPSFMLPFIGLVILPVNPYLALIAVFRAFQLTFRFFLYGIHRGEHYAYVILIAFSGFLVGFLIRNVYAPYLLFLGLISFIAFFYLVLFNLLGAPRLGEFHLLLSYSFFAFVGTLSGVFLVQGPYFLSDHLGGPEVAGTVSAALSAAFLLTYLPQVLQSAIMPLFSYKYGRDEQGYVRRLSEEITIFLTVATGLVVFFLMLVGRELLILFFGFDVGDSFYLALIAMEVYIAYNPSIVALNSTAYVKNGTVVSLLGASVSFFLWFLLIPVYGAIGVMVGLILGYCTILLGTAFYSRRFLSVSPTVYGPLLIAVPLQLSVFISKTALLMAAGFFIVYERKDLRRMLSVFMSFHGR
ncbi:lipopolysaccharide biosynthesis protein, partial [Thermococcus sp.]|uniref:lipopolysaccharide biosynthesis protein n=1 Tax=Thermococcus sp. TaxID=35749 RepID=UPI0025E63E80